MGYKTGYEMRAAAPLLGSLTLPRRCPRSDRGHLPHGAGRGKSDLLRHSRHRAAGQSGHPSPAGRGQRAAISLRPSGEISTVEVAKICRCLCVLIVFLSAFSLKSAKNAAFYGVFPSLPRAGANKKNNSPCGGRFWPSFGFFVDSGNFFYKDPIL